MSWAEASCAHFASNGGFGDNQLGPFQLSSVGVAFVGALGAWKCCELLLDLLFSRGYFRLYSLWRGKGGEDARRTSRSLELFRLRFYFGIHNFICALGAACVSMLKASRFRRMCALGVFMFEVGFCVDDLVRAPLRGITIDVFLHHVFSIASIVTSLFLETPTTLLLYTCVAVQLSGAAYFKFRADMGEVVLVVGRQRVPAPDVPGSVAPSSAQADCGSGVRRGDQWGETVTEREKETALQAACRRESATFRMLSSCVIGRVGFSLPMVVFAAKNVFCRWWAARADLFRRFYLDVEGAGGGDASKSSPSFLDLLRLPDVLVKEEQLKEVPLFFFLYACILLYGLFVMSAIALYERWVTVRRKRRACIAELKAH